VHTAQPCRCTCVRGPVTFLGLLTDERPDAAASITNATVLLDLIKDQAAAAPEPTRDAAQWRRHATVHRLVPALTRLLFALRPAFGALGERVLPQQLDTLTSLIVALRQAPSASMSYSLQLLETPGGFWAGFIRLYAAFLLAAT